MEQVVYRACSVPFVHTPGMFEWCMAVRARDIQKEAKDVGARMYMLAGLLPGMRANHLKMVAEGHEAVKTEINHEDGTVTFTVGGQEE